MLSRVITLNFILDPHDFFQIDSNSGEIRTAKPLDREVLSDTNGVVLLTVKVNFTFNVNNL